MELRPSPSDRLSALPVLSCLSSLSLPPQTASILHDRMDHSRPHSLIHQCLPFSTLFQRSAWSSHLCRTEYRAKSALQYRNRHKDMVQFGEIPCLPQLDLRVYWRGDGMARGDLESLGMATELWRFWAYLEASGIVDDVVEGECPSLTSSMIKV